MRNLVGFLVVPLFLASGAAPAATYTVTSQASSGAGTLAKAITDSNATPGVLDTIVYDIPGTPPFVTLLADGIPAVTDPVVIDGTTQPGYAGAPVIQIRQGLFNGSGLILSGNGTTVRGLSFSDLAEGIRIEGDDNVVEACFVGTDVTGTLDVGNGIGILITGGDGNLIGGTQAAARNLISGNNGFGIRIVGGNGNAIRGNLIGTKVGGLEILPNQIGISIGGAGNDVGGLSGVDGNLISGNTVGVELDGSTDTLIAGNLIGTDATGTLDLGNGTGIQTADPEIAPVIGGTSPAARNVISGNLTGIRLSQGTAGALILGNLVGLDVSGTLPIGNDTGIVVNDAATTDTRIGGVAAGEGNVIAHNGVGVWNLGTRTTIRGNSIYDNDALGIDSGNVGPTPNDPGDGDLSLNFPNIQSVEISAPAGASVRIQGRYATDPGDYTLDFYANPPCADDPREFLEGETWLGSAPLTIAGDEAAFDVTLPVAVEPGSRISATATSANGRTSEFSQRLPFSITPSTGPGAGGTAVEFFGTDFESGLTATIGGVPVTGVVFGGSFFFDAVTPALPGGIYDVTVTNPSGLTGTLPKGWIADFSDVPPSEPFYDFIQSLVSAGITAGAGGGSYGIDNPTLRQQMAVFLLKAKNGICYVPPPCTGAFDDVPCPSVFADWIEALAAAGITGGCGGDNYCPASPVRRDQMAVFLLKAKYGPAYDPPDCDGDFGDVPCPSAFADWIEQLAAEAITGGCGNGNYCPNSPNTRGQMAVFIVKTFELP